MAYSINSMSCCHELHVKLSWLVQLLISAVSKRKEDEKRVGCHELDMTEIMH